MKITVNAKPHEVRAGTLDEALQQLGYAQSTVATAVNGHFVARHARPETQLAEGDRLEILTPMQGG
ncbi:sulfur carrier protein ThiS [Phaeobacter gallaeciensis]|uniref:Thiamine biosynthesis protein ThiS n=1 Tax=Phaeobacter gallaeciensis TaxID=60890 RepID=A0AAC9Z9T6_9RHOB|nr:sulfur carrier protein ThiS [Phaeobacter gallaeciensis]AHD10323.1 thiamine biosynthesis protein ThiS [Phaeobacter gallaeciensis DSM 26640]ATE93587.1 thiamine biosynthesis protein ThiS [Phaeobacter gallaeciensis]ATE96592.1 thiamine biosynthesis protein ThiS [Phaeobacter gallaeciensis]ATF02251.1 thiamine biosynthesis protein ThiS [Phaeobacter gallaeciensis]ATF06631.1 thiamine biosynthesis protein ThiS [Phaeobacter gallaeciensis]